MKTNHVPKFKIILSLFALLGGLQLGFADQHPNVILIMADDVGQECFTAYGAEDYNTPNLDQMAKQGVVFEHCYSQSLCTPSRVKLMTGKYMFRNYTHFGYLRPDQKTLGHLMQAAGYKTSIAGKWQLNGLYNDLPGSDDPTRPNLFGFDDYHLWQLTKGKSEGERYWDTLIESNGKVFTQAQLKGKYGPDLHRDFILNFMEKHKETPFFVYYPMVLVHDPFLPTPDSKNRACKNQKQNFVDMVSYTDKIVGQIIAKTESLGIAENTLIIFTADNGTHTSLTSRWKGQNIKGGKGSMKNSGNHVPLYVYWKGVSPTTARNTDLIEFSDFYATLADLTQQTLRPKDLIDGVSFLPQIKGLSNPHKRDFIIQHYTPFWGNDKNSGRSVRDQTYKLYQDGRFYHVPNDLEEKHALTKGSAGERAESKRTIFQQQLDRLPKFPDELGQQAKTRPIYPDWNPND